MHSQPISKTVIAGIVLASILGFVTILAIVLFLVSQCRKRRAMKKQQAQGQDGQSPVLPMQNPDLEAGLGAFDKKKSDGGLKRSTSQFTIKSFTSRWSQSSFAAGVPPAGDKVLEVPPVPALPRGLPSQPKLNMPAPQHQRSSSSLSGSTGSLTLSPDDESVLDAYYYRQSFGSKNSVSNNHRSAFGIQSLDN